MALAHTADGDVLVVTDGPDSQRIRVVQCDAPHAVWTTDIVLKAAAVTLVPSPPPAGTKADAARVTVAIGTAATIILGTPLSRASASATAQTVFRTAAGGAATGFAAGDAKAARFNSIRALCATADGQRVYLTNKLNHRIRLYDRSTDRLSTVAGTGEQKNGADGPALTTALNTPHALCWDLLTTEPKRLCTSALGSGFTVWT